MTNQVEEINVRANLDAELAVLGAIMLNKSLFMVAANHILNERFFYWQKNRLIWSAISKLIYDGEIIDPITIADKLILNISDGKIDMAYIFSVLDKVPVAGNCEYYSKIVADEYRARELQRAYNRGLEAIKESADPKTVWEKTNESTSGLFKIEETPYSIEALEEKLKVQQPVWGQQWGIQALDSELGQFARGSVIVLGGRPGHCKTSLALQMIDNWAMMGERVFFQSMEMSREEIDMRRLSRFSKIPLSKIKHGGQDIKSAVYEIKCREKNVFVSDSSGLTPEEVVLNIRIMHETNGITFFVLDHFHRLRFPNSGREHRHNLEEGFEHIISACKNKNITPLILAQLNRGIERTQAGESEREPQLVDLRECGRLEEAATNVLMIYWKFKKTQNTADLNEIKVISAKFRDGKTGRVFMHMEPEIYTFGNLIKRSD